MDREILLGLPPGQYTPTFIRRPETDAPIGIAPVEIEIAPETVPPAAAPHLAALKPRSWLVAVLGTAIVLAAIAVLWFARPDTKRLAATPAAAGAAKPAAPDPAALEPGVAGEDDGAGPI